MKTSIYAYDIAVWSISSLPKQKDITKAHYQYAHVQEDASNTKKIKNKIFFFTFLSLDAHACTHARTCACMSNQKDDSNTKKIKNIFFYLRKFLSLDAHACTHARTCAHAPNQKDDSNIFGPTLWSFKISSVSPSVPAQSSHTSHH